MSVDVDEVTTNLRTMLRMNPKRFGIMVERQVQFALLPRLAGTRSSLEQPLWELLLLLLDGPEGEPRTLEDTEVATAAERARDGEAHFPKSAAAVAEALETLREHGLLPAPAVSEGAG